MPKIKRVINCIVPVTACNFKCHYCYIGQTNEFHNEIKELPYDLDKIAYALRPERLGGKCFINFCAMGETLLAPYLVSLCEKLLNQGHLIGIVTNGVLSDKINEFCALKPELRKNLFFKFSFHYLELLRSQTIEHFCKNVQNVKKAGCAFTIELTVNDETLPYMNELQSFCLEKFGAYCHAIESRDNTTSELIRLTKLPLDEHLYKWSKLQSPLLEYQQAMWGKRQNKFCYAGDWLVNFMLESGDITTCLGGGNLVTNLYSFPDEDVALAAVGRNCPWPHCYPAYVTLTLGTVPSLQAPPYISMRNRKCLDGTEWLNETYKEAFGGFLKESNVSYSKEKSSYIDALMAVEYKNETAAIDLKEIARILKTHLSARGIKSVGIFGINDSQGWLCTVLQKSGIKVKFVVDSACPVFQSKVQDEEIKRRLKYTVKKILRRQVPIVLNLNDSWPKVGAIIVSEFPQISISKLMISHKGISPNMILSSADLVQ